jgi:hypothetical protein
MFIKVPFYLLYSIKCHFYSHSNNLAYPLSSLCVPPGVRVPQVENRCCSIHRDRSFDRITFLRNSSVVLSKIVSKEKISSFEYRPRLNVLSNDFLLNDVLLNDVLLNDVLLNDVLLNDLLSNGLIRSIDLAWFG